MSKRNKFESVLLLLLIFSLFSVRILTGKYIRPTKLISSMSDLAIIFPYELKMVNPELYDSDRYFIIAFNTFESVWGYRALYSSIAHLGLILRNLELANAIVSGISTVVFLGGIFYLFKYLTGNLWIGLLGVLFSSTSALALGGMNFGGINYGFAIAHDIFSSIAIWLILLFSKCLGSHRRLILFFFLLGILTNFYALGTSHLVLLCWVAVLIHECKAHTPVPIMALRLFVYSIVFIPGAIPSVLAALSLSKGFTSGDVPFELLQKRFAYVLFTPTSALHKIVHLFIPTLLGLWGYYVKKKEGDTWPGDGKVHHLFWAALSLTLFGIISSYNRALFNFFFSRVSFYLYIFAYMYASYGVTSLIKRRNYVSVFLAALVIIALMIPKEECLVRPLQEVELVLLKYVKTDHKPSIPPPTSPAKTRDFLLMAEWVKSNTPIDSLFIVPPGGDFPAFRYYAQRGVVCDFKMGSIVQSNVEMGKRWIHAYTEISEVYEAPSSEAIIEFGRNYEADYIILDKKQPGLLLPICYQNDHYLVYRY